MPTLFGTDPNQVPTNADLGSLAFTDGKGAGNISAGTVDVIRANKITNVSNIRPSLDLNFTTKKLDPRITFTRTSTATYVGADGLVKYAVADEPRFDHDPVTGECKGLLIEEQRTNLIGYSEQFDNWSKHNFSVTSNVTISPDGNVTADKIYANASTTSHYIQFTPASGFSDTTYTASVYVKSAEYTNIQLLWSTAASTNYANFNLVTGSVSFNNSLSATITNVGNGWYRCSITSTLNAGTYAFIILPITSPSDSRLYGYTADGVSGVYVWGGQVELGSFATSYIPNNTASSWSRTNEYCRISDLSSFYNQSAGTLFADFTLGQDLIGGRVFAFSGTSGNSMAILGASSTVSANGTGRGPYFYVQKSSTNQYSSPSLDSYLIPYANTKHKVAGAYAYNDIVNVTNGLVMPNVVSQPNEIPTVTYLDIGSRSAGDFLNGWIRRLSYYPKRLSDAELKELTK